MGYIRQRVLLLSGLQDLRQVIVATDQEVLRLIEQNRLFGRGIGYVEAHLLAAARLSAGTLLWTFDNRLAAAAVQLRLEYQPPK